jgi:acyl-CoA reductase-like NAD-dependent aldehyde dehydrogenase
VEGRVVVAKAHPLNESVTSLLYEVFSDLERDGFFGKISGGTEVAQLLLHHPQVTSWMMTGGEQRKREEEEKLNEIVKGDEKKKKKKLKYKDEII